MLKYCFIKDKKTGLVQIGVGCPDEYYIEIGMEQRDVEQSEVDFQWYLTEKCPQITKTYFVKGAITNNKSNIILEYLKQFKGGIHCLCAEEMQE